MMWFVSLARRAGLAVLAQATGMAFLVYLAFSIVVLVLEIRRAGHAGILRTRAFMNDALYALFYRGGFFAVLIWAAVANVFQRQLAFLQLGWLKGLPMVLAVPLYWIVGDFLLYWLHRLLHSVPALWAFHSVHHTERQLSTLSQNRRHPVEYLLNSLVLYLPLAFVLGIPTRSWVVWYMAAQLLEALQHAQLDWSFGPLYRWLVSPVFHSIHHSTDPKHFNRNYGPMLSAWDYLFGTAAAEARRPSAYGVDGLAIPETLRGQLVAPLRMLTRPAGAEPGRPVISPAAPPP